MSQLTFGSQLSRLRKRLKAQNMDSNMTNRDLWSLFFPHLSETIKEVDSRSRLMGFSSIFQTLDYVPLVQIDKVEAKDLGIKSGITMSRTEKPVPFFMEGYAGPLIRSITSLDGSVILSPTTPSKYQAISSVKTSKYNKTKYYWYINDLLYFPNIDWPGVRIEAITVDDISEYKQNADEACLPKLQQSLNIPDFIIARSEAKLFSSLGITLQIPTDVNHDNQNLLK